jgi:hypothetical protein
MQKKYYGDIVVTNGILRYSLKHSESIFIIKSINFRKKKKYKKQQQQNFLELTI